MGIIIVIVGILFVYILFKALFSYKLKLQTVNCYTGGLGSGKTLNAVKTAIKIHNRSKLMHYLFSWNLGLLPSSKVKITDNNGNIIYTYNKYDIREIYSNFPILIKYNKNPSKCIYSIPLTRDHILGKIRIKEHSIVIVDEGATFFPFQNKRSDPDLIWDLTYFRQYTDSVLIVCCQSLGNVDISFRRVINVVYNFSSYRNLPFRFYTIDVQKMLYNEDINIVNTNDINEDNTLKLIGRHWKYKKYDSRYMRKFYNPNQELNYKFTSLLLEPDNELYSKEKFKNMFYQGK